MLLVRLCFALVFDVGQLLALYFSLVVLFHSHICRLFWCFIIVFGFWDGNKIYDDDDTYHTGPIMLMLESMYVASQQCLWQPHFREGGPNPSYWGQSPLSYLPFSNLLFHSIRYLFLFCLFPLYWEVAAWPTRRSGEWCELLCWGPHQNSGYRSIFGIFFLCLVANIFVIFVATKLSTVHLNQKGRQFRLRYVKAPNNQVGVRIMSTNTWDNAWVWGNCPMPLI